MNRIPTLFLWLTIIGPLHMGEQMLTSIEEFYAIRGLAGHYYALFPATAADHASVLLVTIVWTLVSIALYAVLKGGRARLVVAGVAGVFGATEIHHLIEAIVTLSYDPGVLTCIPYAIVGGLLTVAVWRELQVPMPVVAAERRLA
jgi:hypothetical protein